MKAKDSQAYGSASSPGPTQAKCDTQIATPKDGTAAVSKDSGKDTLPFLTDHWKLYTGSSGAL